MTLSLRIPAAIDELDACHLRHQYEALVAHPEVLRVPEGHDAITDYAITLPYSSAKKHVFLCRYDPHMAVADFDAGMSVLVDPAMEAMMPQEDRDKLRGPYATHLREHCEAGRVITDFDRYDILATGVLNPWNRGLLQKLSKAKFLHAPMCVPAWGGKGFDCTLEEERPWDVFFLGVAYYLYPMRLFMLKQITALVDASRITYLNPVSFTANAQLCRAAQKDLSLWDNHQREYAGWLRSAKVFPFCGSVFSYPVQKYFGAMACGCLVLAPMPIDGEELHEFKDGKNLIVVNKDNFVDKMLYYIDPAHETERLEITREARDLVRRRFTCEAQADILVKKLTMIRDENKTIEEANAWGSQA